MDSTQPRWRTSYDLEGPDYHGSVDYTANGYVAWLYVDGAGTTLGTFPSSYDAKQAVEKAVWNRAYQAVSHA